MFEAIVGDLDIIMNQYGDPVDHENEEAMSRCLAPLFKRTVALFQLTVRNIPKSTIPGCMTTKGRVKYRFVVFGRLSLLVIEVKFELGTGEERANALGQAIVECDAYDYSNDRQNFPSSPIYGILCDERTFEFFMFDGGTSPPTFSRGICRNFPGLIDSLRPVCEITPGWRDADKFAALALSHAMNAALVATNLNPAADGETEDALNYLQQSLEAIPPAYKKNRNLLSSWNKDRFNFS